MTAQPAAPATYETLVGQVRDLAYKYIQDKDFTSAQLAFKKLLELDGKDINARASSTAHDSSEDGRTTPEPGDLPQKAR